MTPINDTDLNRGRGSSQTEPMAAQSFPNPKARATLRERKSKIANPKSKMV